MKEVGPICFEYSPSVVNSDEVRPICPGRDEAMSAAVRQAVCQLCLPVAFNQSVVQRVALRQRVDKIERELEHDSLTHLLTRPALERQFLQYRNEGIPQAVMFLDIEDFKTINDQYGHNGGDRVLEALGLALNANLRSSDVIARLQPDGVQGIAGRRGGDEFVVIVRLDETVENSQEMDEQRHTETTTIQRAELAQKRIMQNINSWFQEALDAIQLNAETQEKIDCHLKFHVGMEVSDLGDKRTFNQLITNADPDKKKDRILLFDERLWGGRELNQSLRTIQKFGQSILGCLQKIAS